MTLRLSWCPTFPHALLAAASEDGSIFVWDLDGSNVRTCVADGLATLKAAVHLSGVTTPCDDGNEAPGAPVATLLTPSFVCGPSTRGGGGRFDASFMDASSAFRSLHAAPVRGIKWSPAPMQMLASVGQDGMLLLWDWRSCWAPIQQHNVAAHWLLDVEWSPCGRKLLTRCVSIIVHATY